ncbi:MAG: helix-turn-helix domain-containing protein [Cyclobacteriaceae bacterium]|jgi:chromosomal replication initiation ATPase DnaA
MKPQYTWDVPKRTYFFDVAVTGQQQTRNSVMEAVCEEMNVTAEELRGSQRKRAMVDARSVYSYLLRKYLNDTYHHIGMELNRDYTTVINLHMRAESLISINDRSIRYIINKLEQKLFNHQ